MIKANGIIVGGEYNSDDGTFLIPGIKPVDSLLYIKHAYNYDEDGEIKEYMDETFSLYVSLKQGSPAIQLMSDLQPTISNIILKLPAESLE